MRIIYKNTDNSVGVLIPTDEALSFATIEQIAEKDVPSPYKYPAEWGVDEYGDDIVLKYETYNTPYWIVDASNIPTDRTFRSAWEIDESLGSPDGFGGESNEFSELQLRKKFMIDLAKYFVLGLRNTVPDIKDRVLKYIEKSKFFERDGLIDEFIQYAEDYDSQLEKELLNDNNK